LKQAADTYRTTYAFAFLSLAICLFSLDMHFLTLPPNFLPSLLVPRYSTVQNTSTKTIY